MSPYESVHAWDNLVGVGDARPTALQIIKDNHKDNALKGQVILITGVTSGLGAASAIALASTGTTIFCAGRNIPKAKQALQPIADSPNVHFLQVDLSSQASVKAFAAEFLKESGGRLNVLMNNAGGITEKYKKTEDGVEHQFAVNYLSPFLLFSLLKPALLASATAQSPSRVINLTSFGHRYSAVQFSNLNLENGAYQATVAYGQAKTAAVYMASEIERRYGAQNLHAWSVHPGVILESSFMSNSGWSQEVIDGILAVWPAKLFKSNEQGAATQVWAVVNDDLLADGARGKYLEDCSVAKYKAETDNQDFKGYVDHTYDEESAKKLWEVSEELLGIKV